jgi:putative transposase
MERFYYENKLSNQNITAKPNIAWAADITEFELVENKKLYVFLCLDMHTNSIIAHTAGKKMPTSSAIVKCLEQAIDKRFRIVPRTPVIIHTDRGTQFSSRKYSELTKKYKKFFIPSMSRATTPTDNPVAERLMRTFKEHSINGKPLQEFLFDELELYGEIKSYQKIVNKYVGSLNQTPNKKSLLKAPEQHDMDVSTASMSVHSKGFSERFGKDIRNQEIEKFKDQNLEVIGILQELAARKSEIVDTTPFDDYESNLALKLIDQRLTELYSLIIKSPEISLQYVEEAIEPVTNSLDHLHKKVDILLPNKKRVKDVRDPLDYNLYPRFMANAGNVFKRQHELKRAQLRVAYTILYYAGFRLNEIRNLTQKDIQKAIASSQFNIIQHKTNKAHIQVLPRKALEDLKKLNLEYEVIFEKYKYKFLFGKVDPIADKSLIRFINKDLAYTCEIGNIPYNIKSHSFRINVISSLLRVTSVQNTADIMGHEDIRSTMYYRRYALSKNEIRSLLD